MPSPVGDAQKAYDDWVAANEAVKDAKKNAQDAKDKLANIMAVSATGGITEGEEKALAKARDEVAKAEAALKDAEAKLEAARIELEKAIAELEDEKLKKELIRKRDGYIAAQRFTAIVPAKASSETKSGLRTISFDTTHGKIKVYLPDDMRAGDTISGTVVAEPNGRNDEERGENLRLLQGKAFEIKDFSFGVENPTTIHPVIGGTTGNTIPIANNQTFTMTIPNATSRVPAPNMVLRFVLSDPALDKNTAQFFEIKDFSFGVENPTKSGNTSGSSAEKPSLNDFKIPTIGQQGRPIEIFGPFDGDSSNTTLTMQDLESHTLRVARPAEDFLKPRSLVESPRKIVFESPTNFTGPAEIVVKEGDVEKKGNFRNVGVNLSAPKTNLMRGERTTLTVEVRGLEGIKEDVPLQLDAMGVITMEGGSFQNLRIKPSEVTPEGRYITNRAITGVQPGGFNVTATVMVRPFDVCLQDDSQPSIVVLWNTVTGDYIFNCPACLPPRQGGGSQTGTGTTVVPPGGGSTFTGTGKMAMKGCIITLSHNAPDRRVFAKLDACTKSGEATVEPSASKTKFTITDRNIADNPCPSAPPK